MTDGLHRFREGTNSRRRHRPRPVIAESVWGPLVLGSLVTLGIGPTTSRSLVAPDSVKLIGQKSFVRTAPNRLGALEPLSFAHVPSLRYTESATAGGEGSTTPKSVLEVHPRETAHVRLHTLEPPSFVCTLTTMPLAGTATAVWGADVLRLGIS